MQAEGDVDTIADGMAQFGFGHAAVQRQRGDHVHVVDAGGGIRRNGGTVSITNTLVSNNKDDAGNVIETYEGDADVQEQASRGGRRRSGVAVGHA